jgi:hypothetical protein
MMRKEMRTMATTAISKPEITKLLTKVNFTDSNRSK